MRSALAVKGLAKRYGSVEAPDTATIARVSVALGARGSTRIETLPALTIDEFVQTLS